MSYILDFVTKNLSMKFTIFYSYTSQACIKSKSLIHVNTYYHSPVSVIEINIAQTIFIST